MKENKLSFKNTLMFITALGVLGNTIELKGTNITAGGSLTPDIEKNGNITNIWAGKVDGSNAFNHFKDFDLSANDIANLYFNKRGETASADKLFNFVDNQIKVNGIVNAIKNNKIGGDLYFLSNNGMIVGSSGVINTGSLYVLTPSLEKYNSLLANATGETFENVLPEIMTGQIPLNPEGTITVKGQIRATNNIAMYAGTINIGDAEDQNVNNKVILETGIEFKDLVNIEKTGLVEEAGKLEAHQVENGNIILIARADSENTTDQIFNDHFGSIVNVDNFVSRDIKAEININGSIKAVGDVDIKAEATNGTVLVEDEESGKLYNSNPLASTTAKVNINKGNIDGKNVDISATTENKYMEVAGASTQGAGASMSIIGNAVKINGSVGALKGDASINIGENASINASENLDINAKNDVSLTLGATTSAKKSKLAKLLGIKNEIVGGESKPGLKASLPAVGAAVGYTEGNASIDVKGTLTSGKDMNITASSSNELDLNATAMAKDESKFVFGLGLGVGSNNSSINLENANIKAGEDLNIKSSVKNSVTSIVEVVTGNKNPASTALNLVAYDSSSKVNIKNSELNSENGNLNISSENIVTENKIISDNNAGKKKNFLKKLAKDELTAIKDLEESQKLINNLKNKLGFGETSTQANAESNGQGEKKKGIGEKITLGAGMAFVGEENTSDINIQGSNIKAKKDVNITSKTEVLDTLMSVAGDTVTDSKKKDVLIAAGVLYGQMGNTSSIVIDGEDSDTSSTISAVDGNIKIDSLTQMKYDRINHMVNDLNDSIDALKSSMEDLKKFISEETLESLKAELETLEKDIKDFQENMKGVELDSLFGEEGVYKSYNLILQAQKISEQLTTIAETVTPNVASFITNISDTIMNVANFANVGNYGNFSVRTTARNQEGKTVGIAGSVSMTNLQNDSKIVIGKNTQIISEKNNVDIKSTNNTEAVNVGGNIGQLIIKANGGSSEDGTAIGGSFIMQDFDVNNIIAIAEGAKIKGSNINISADSNIFNVNSVLSAGSSAGNAIDGMVSYSTGSINNLISIDDEVLLETTGSEENSEDDKINILSNANASITNVAGGMAKSGSIGVGVGVAINEFDVINKIEIKDNDNNEELSSLVNHEHKNKILDVIQGNNIGDLIFTDDEDDKQNQGTNIGLFDGSSIEGNDKGIIANELNANTNTTGMINSVSVAGALSSKKEGEEKKEGIFDSLKKDLTGKVDNFNNQLNGIIGKFNNNGAVNEFMNKGTSQTGTTPLAEESSNNVVDNSTSEMTKPSINIAGAGSSSVNLIDNITNTEIDGVQITLKENNSNINVSAKDDSFTGAWSGAAAINWINKKGGTDGQPVSSGTSVGVHGAVGVNIIERATTAIIKNSTIKNASQINVAATNSSVTTAAGLGLGLANVTGAENKNYQGGASVSLNSIDHKTSALLENVTSTSEETETTVNINALEDGIQVTGGINIDAGKSNGAAGAAVTVANINNELTSGIKGGNLKNIKDISVNGILDVTQITAAVGIGATSSPEKNLGTFEGAVVYNSTENRVNSFIDSTDIEASNDINVTAGDKKSSNEKNKYEDMLEDFGIDADGSEYYSGIDKSLSGESGEKDLIENTKGGSTIVNGALTVAGSNSNALGAGVVVSDIENTFSAEIKGKKENNIKADKIDVNSSNDTFIVGAAGGIGVGKDTFGGMGSVSWQDLSNNTISKISGVNITAREVNVNSQNDVFEVNSGGQITYGGKAAAGAVLSYMNINNSTSSIIEDTVINLTKDSQDDEKKSINVSSKSNIESYNIGAGVGVSSGSASVAGTVAVSQGGNNTLSSIENTTIKDVDNINAVAKDENKNYTIVGTVSGAKNVAIGGAGAYNELDSNKLKAIIKNSNIITDLNGNINIGALDNSLFHTIAAGVGGSTKVAVNGAAAISIIDKEVEASMENVNINSDTEDKKDTNLNIISKNNGEIVSNASVVAGSGTAAVGIGTAINTINQNTSSTITGGIQENMKDIEVQSKSLANITTIGIGGGVAGTAGVSGSIAVNKITNNTTANMNNTTINADGSVGVVSESDDVISNYAGTISGAGTAAVGASVSVNEISGNTMASVENSTVIANGNGDGIKTHEDVDNDNIINSIIDEETAELGNNLKDKRKETVNKGIVVSSSSTHTLKSLLANGGLGGTAAVNGTVNVNQINGSTGANVIGSTLNSAKDLNINASDYTNSSGIVGSAAFAGNAGIGASSDTNIIKRDVMTNLSGSNLSGNNINIEAISKQGISSFGIGMGAAVTGAGVAGVVTVVDLEGNTAMNIDDTDITSSNDILINSDHYGVISLGSGSLGGAVTGAGVGAGVSVIKDNNKTDITIENDSNIKSENNTNIKAENYSKLQTAVTSVGLAGMGAGVAGTVSINNIANGVSTNILDSNITSTNGNISINSKNTIDTALISAGGAGGFAGIGAVVNINTIDSSVITNISDTDITAENGAITANAEETRNIDQTFANVTGGAAAIGGNVIINNFGTAVDGNIEISKGFNIDGAYAQANGTQENKFDEQTQDILNNYGINGSNYGVKADKGGTNSKSDFNEGIKVNISNGSNIKGKEVKLTSNEINNIDVAGGGGSAGAVSASGSVAITNIDRNIGVNVSDSIISSKEKLNIETKTLGNVDLEVYQGSAGIAGLGAAYAEINSTGKSLINISNSELKSEKDIDISNEDTITLNGTASGLAGGIIAAGVIISDVENSGTVGIKIENSDIQAEENLNINSKKENEINSEAIGGSVGVAAGVGVSSIAKDSGTSKLEILNSVGKISSLNGTNINMKAINNMAVNAKTGSVATGALAGVGVSVSMAEASGNAIVSSNERTAITGDDITITAEIGTVEGKENTISAETDSVGGGGVAGVDTNTAKITNNSSSQVNLTDVDFDGKTSSKIKNLNVLSRNNTKLKADIDSLSFGGIFAAGANTALVSNNGNSSVNISNSEKTDVENLKIEGTTSSENIIIANGNGGGGIAAGAAIVENNINTNTDINVGGNWNVSKLLEAIATDNNIVTINADSTRGGFIGANGITIKNEIKSDKATKVTIKDGTNITGSGRVNIESQNDVDVDIDAKGAAYGGAGFADVNITNAVDKKSEVEIGKVNIKTEGSQEYQAFTNADILIKNKIDAAGAIAATTGRINNTLNTKNNVSLAQGGHLETTNYGQDITLAASDKIKDVAEGIAETSGAGGASKADVTSNLDRKNRIDVNGNILSYNDVKLYAGMDKTGKKSSVDYKALSHSYTHGVFTGADPSISTDISMENQVATGQNSKVESVRNINIEANSGENRIEKAVQKYTWYDQENSSDYVTTDNGEINKNVNKEDNYADIQGEMTAGIYANQEIVIDGVVDLNKGENGKTDIVDANVTSKPDITYGEGTKIDIETGIENYANSLIKRYNEICGLLESYSDKSSAAYQGYQAEKVRILNTMLSLGLAEEITKNDGTKAIVPVGKLDVQYIKIGDIVASGGNIVINSQNIKNVEEGINSGRIEANGNPQISITNNSNLYLKVGDIRILEKGGKISFNNKVLKDVSTDEKSAINITNNWDSTLKVLDKNGNKQDVKVLSTIEINGNIENLIGDINIINKGGDILMQGENIGDSTNIIAGGNLNLSAKGSISQAYTEGITNIGTAPEEAWKDDMQNAKDEVSNGNNFEENQHQAINKDTGIKGSSSSGMVAGGEIYLNGEVINVNGKVQSGFDKYEVTINGDTKGYNNQTVSDLIASYDKEWANNKTTITDNNIKDYILTEGGNRYDEKTGTFYYEPATYYDPSTKQVVVENIDVGGGKVYITGRVISTGNGKITALDGAANINIDNNTNSDLRVGTINNKNVDGLISINDTQKNIITEYTRDKTIIKEITDKKDSNGNYIYNVKEIAADGSERYYTPDEGMRYNWTEGSETTTETKYTQSNDFYLWGGIRLSMEEVISQGKGESQGTIVKNENGKPVGSFISQDKNNSHDFSLDFTNKVNEEDIEIVGKHEWTDYHDFLHFSGTDYYEWTEKKGTEQIYTGSIKADRNIGISFIGSENGNINIESNKNIELAGSVTNARGENGTSITNITSENGSIIGSVGTITADTINFSGKNGIENIVISGIDDTVNLKANAVNGNVGITAKGNVVLDEIVGKNRVELSAYGDIYQQNKGKAGITGSRIDLVSEIGGIDLIINSGDNPLVGGDTLSASVNASAEKDINLKESEGDMRIGKIYSSQGDVTLETEGYIVDALPTGDELENSSTEEMINRWEEAGLIDSDELREEKQNQYNEYANGVKNEYQEYLNLKEQGSLEEGSIEAKRLAKLDEKYGSYENVDDYLNNSPEGQNQIKLRDSGGKWNKEQLLYAIKDNIVNQEGGSTQKEVKDPNVKGKNITIKAGKGVGIDKGETVIDLNNLDTEALKKLSSSEAADVTWDNEKGVAIIREKNPIGIQMTSEDGKLNVEAKDNIYLAARTESKDSVNTIYVDNIKTDGNIRLLGTHGVYNVSNGENLNFEGKDLILEGGAGDLGAVNNALTMGLTGKLTARTDKNVYLHQEGDMNIVAMYAGETVNLDATGNIFSKDEDGIGSSGESTDGSGEKDENLVIGYINANGDITLNAGKDIGEEKQGLNIKNGTDSKVHASANNIYLNGKKDGALNLGTVIAKNNIDITSESGIKTTERLSSENINLESKADIELGGEIFSSDNFEAISKEGKITEIDGAIINSNTASIKANSGILLSQNNSFNNLNLSNNIGDIVINNKNKDLNLNIEKSNSGNIEINNENGDININSDIITTGEKDIIISSTGNIDSKNYNLSSSNDLKLSSTINGTITGNGVWSSEKDMTVNAVKGDIVNGGNIKAIGDLALSTGAGDISGNSISGNNVTLGTTDGNILVNELTSEGNTEVSTKETGDISLNEVISNGVTNVLTKVGSINVGTLNSTGNTTLRTENGNISNNSLESGGTTNIETETGSITLGKVDSTGDLTISTSSEEQSNITVNESLNTSGELKVSTNKGNINLNNSSVSSSENFAMNTVNGSIIGNGEWSSGKDMTISTINGDIVNGESITVSGDLTVGTVNGDISGNSISGNNVALGTTKGNISVNELTSEGNTEVSTKETGDINLNEVISKGRTDILTKVGSINVETLNSTGNTTLKTENGSISNSSLESSGTTNIETETGSVTLGRIDGKENISIMTNEGNITGNNISSQNGNIIISAIKTGKVLVSNLINAMKGNVSITTNNGDIETNKIYSNNDTILSTNIGNITTDNIEAGRDTKIISTTEGNITVNNSLNSNRNIDISTAKGNIFVNNLTSKDGKVKIDVLKEGDISSAGRLESLNSTLEIHTALGDIDFNEIYAKKDLGIGTENGSLIGKIADGENIVIVVKNREDNMKIDKIIAGKGLTISSNRIDIDDFIQRDDADGMLEFRPQGSNGNEMIDSIEINNVETENGLLIPYLWAKYANIGVNSPKFYISNLRIADKGYFHDDDTYVTVWGSAPILDDNDMQFWQDKDEPIYLFFLEDKNKVTSNGLLLKGEDYFYPYAQRFSAVQVVSKNLSESSQSEYGEILRFNASFDDIFQPFITNGIDTSNFTITDTDIELFSNEEKIDVIVEDNEIVIKSNNDKIVLN